MHSRNTTNITGKNTEEYSFVIVSAGVGRRMRSLGPKSLLKLTDRGLTIIENQINIIKDCFSRPEIVLVTGFESDKVMKNTPEDIIKIENENYETTNNLRSIGIGLRGATRDKVVVIYGDTVFNKELFYGVNLSCSSLIVETEEDNYMARNEIGCNVAEGMVQYLLPDVKNKWAQVAYFEGKELEIFRKICWSRRKFQCYGFEAINETIDKGGRFKAVSPRGMKVMDVDSSKDLAIARELI
jgi:choline kinase